MARTERESDSWRREEKWQTCWYCRDQQRACRMAQASAEKLEHTGPAEKVVVFFPPLLYYFGLCPTWYVLKMFEDIILSRLFFFQNELYSTFPSKSSSTGRSTLL